MQKGGKVQSKGRAHIAIVESRRDDDGGILPIRK